MANRNAQIAQIISECERYWIGAGVSDDAVREMKSELELHLREAEREGKSPESVVGNDLAAFAEAWAAEQRDPSTTEADWEPGNGEPRIQIGGITAVALIAIGVVLVALIFGPKVDESEVEVWRWIWVGAAVFLGIAEMLTAGFFMLPFAIGAVAAAILAWFSVSVPLQLLVFIIVSILSLVGFQRFMRREEEEVPAVVGATRFEGRRAMVLEDIDRRAGTGSVRMDTEQWRATTKSNDIISAGTEVTVVEVVGTRLVVEPLSQESPS